MVIVSNIVIAILHDTGKNEHTRRHFHQPFNDHAIGHTCSYNRGPWHILWYTEFNLYGVSFSTFYEYSDNIKKNIKKSNWV